jgi:hypothetical protein
MVHKVCNTCQESKPCSEYSKAKVNRDGLRNNCKICQRIQNLRIREHHRDMPDSVAALKSYNARYNKANRKKKIQLNKAWIKRNPSKVTNAWKRWQAANRDKTRRNSSKRRAAKLRATPVWAESEWEQFLILEFYNLAVLRQNYTGIAWHVDHIVPLQSDLVCGLHCASNMQVMVGSENISKGNRFWPDMW